MVQAAVSPLDEQSCHLCIEPGLSIQLLLAENLFHLVSQLGQAQGTDSHSHIPDRGRNVWALLAPCSSTRNSPLLLH